MPTNDTAQQIIDVCRTAFVVGRNDCNRFLKEVCNGLGHAEWIDSKANADSIVLSMQAGERGWTPSADGDGGAAAEAARQGMLVVVGLTSAELNDTNGHVAVVIAGELAPNGYPLCYCGSLNLDYQSQGDSIRKCFSKPHADMAHYFTHIV